MFKRKLLLINMVIILALTCIFLPGCSGERALTKPGGPQEQARDPGRGVTEPGLAPPQQATQQALEPGGQQAPPAQETKGPDPRAFVHRFMRCRLLEPFGERAYAMLTERGRQAFINSSDPTLGGAPVMQRMTGYRLEDVTGGSGSWTATLTVWLTGPAEQAESMFYREKLTIVRQGEGFAVDAWEPGNPAWAYAVQRWTTLCLKDAAGKEQTVTTSGQIPVPFAPQGDNPQQKVTSAGEFKCVALFPDGRAAFATLDLFGSTVGVAVEGQKAQVLDRFDSWVNELVWAPGGRLLAVEAQMPSGRTDIMIYDVAAGRRVYSLSEALKEKELYLTRGCWLADDRYFYFFSAASGKGPQRLWKLDTGSGKVEHAQVPDQLGAAAEIQHQGLCCLSSRGEEANGSDRICRLQGKVLGRADPYFPGV